MFPPPPSRSQYSVLNRVRVTVLVELVLVFLPSLVSRVELLGLASKQQASNKQASEQQARAKWGGNHSSVVVLSIRPKFWWMLPMGVRDNHTKYEPKTQRWRLGTGVASTGTPFQNLQYRAKISLVFLPKTPLEPAANCQMKGNSGYSTHAARLPRAKGPSRAL